MPIREQHGKVAWTLQPLLPKGEPLGPEKPGLPAPPNPAGGGGGSLPDLPPPHGLKESLQVAGLDLPSPQLKALPWAGLRVGSGGKDRHLFQDDEVVLCRCALVDLLLVPVRRVTFWLTFPRMSLWPE